MLKKDKTSTREKESRSQSKKLKRLNNLAGKIIKPDVTEIEIPEDPTDIDISKVAELIPAVVETNPANEVTGGKPKKLRKKSKASEREHYVNSKDFEERIKKYYETGDLTDDLAESINKIANGLSFAPNFINYSYKDEMVGDAVVKMFSALKNKKYKPGTGFSPFSYFTTIAFHAFINRIKKEKKYHDAINEYKEKIYTDAMHAGEGVAGAVYIEPTRHDDTGDGQYD